MNMEEGSKENCDSDQVNGDELVTKEQDAPTDIVCDEVITSITVFIELESTNFKLYYT